MTVLLIHFPLRPPLRSPIEDPPLPKKAAGLSSQSWYHSTLDRKNAEAKIKRYSKASSSYMHSCTYTRTCSSLNIKYNSSK